MCGQCAICGEEKVQTTFERKSMVIKTLRAISMLINFFFFKCIQIILLTHKHYKSKSVTFKNGCAVTLHVQTIPLLCTALFYYNLFKNMV